MNRFIVTLAFAAFAMLVSTGARAEFLWRTFGTDPYAATRAEAMEGREKAFLAMGLPGPVIALLLEATKHPGEKILLTNGTRLSAMLSTGGKVHREVLVAFIKPTVNERMEYAAPAEQWEVSFEGKTYTVILPEVCYNWSSITPTTLACVTVTYAVKPGDEVRFAILAQKRLSSSDCWKLCDGDTCSAPPSPCDTCDWSGPKSVIPAGFEPLHTGKYIAQTEQQSFSFPREEAYFSVCDERFGLQSLSWIVPPSQWERRASVSIPYGGQEWPVWDTKLVDLSKWPNRQ